MTTVANVQNKRLIGRVKAEPLTETEIDSVAGGATEIKSRTGGQLHPEIDYEYDS